MANAWDFSYIWVEHDTINDKGYPTFMGYVPVNGTSVCPYLANGQVRKLVSSVSGLTHLEGQRVLLVADGVIANPSVSTVSSGSVALSTPAAVIHVGLPYVGKMQMLPLGGDAQTINETKHRKVYSIVMRLWQSLGGKFGKDEDNLFPLEYGTVDDVLFTGDMHDVPFESSWDTIWQPTFVTDDPLPIMILALVIKSEISDDK